MMCVCCLVCDTATPDVKLNLYWTSRCERNGTTWWWLSYILIWLYWALPFSVFAVHWSSSGCFCVWVQSPFHSSCWFARFVLVLPYDDLECLNFFPESCLTQDLRPFVTQISLHFWNWINCHTNVPGKSSVQVSDLRQFSACMSRDWKRDKS